MKLPLFLVSLSLNLTTFSPHLWSLVSPSPTPYCCHSPPLPPLQLPHTLSLTWLSVPADRVIIPAVRYKYFIPLDKQCLMTNKPLISITQSWGELLCNWPGEKERRGTRGSTGKGLKATDKLSGEQRRTELRKKREDRKRRGKQRQSESGHWMGERCRQLNMPADHWHRAEISLSYFDKAPYFRPYVSQNTQGLILYICPSVISQIHFLPLLQQQHDNSRTMCVCVCVCECVCVYWRNTSLLKKGQ